MKNTIIIDNSPTAYLFHPECSLPITSWYDDMNDNELLMLIPILEALARAEDVREYLHLFVKDNKVLFAKAAQVLRGGKL